MIASTSLCPVCHSPHTSAETTCQTCGLIFATLTAGNNTSSQPHLIVPSFVLQSGQQLDHGRYTVQRSLVRGGMDTLYLAIDHAAFDRTVVIKVLRVSAQDTHDPKAEAEAQRFVQEARTLAALKHPAIPQIMAFFQDGAHSCIVMEYIEGYDLFQTLTHVDEASGRLVVGKPYPPEDVLRWGIELCRVLEYLASRQPPVVHHDIKPANLMRDANSNTLFLVDFGTAHSRQLALGGVPQHIQLYGTPGYAPPEQYRGTSRVRSDVYALAATLYHLLTDDDPGHHPFTFPRLAQLGRMGRVLGEALNKYVDERPTATQFRQQLEALPGAASTRTCVTPDGTVTIDESELVAWCEQHWSVAVAWLYPGIHATKKGNSLIEQVEQAWGTREFVHKLRLSADVYATDPHQGLDTVLALIDPQGFGAAQPSLAANHAGVDFGTHDSATAPEQTLAITNTSRRAFAAEFHTPAWATVVSSGEPATITFAPKQSASIKLGLYDHLEQSGFLSGELTLTTEMVTMLRVPLRAQITQIVPTASPPTQQPIQAAQHRGFNKGFVIGVVILLFMLFTTGLDLGTNGFVIVMFVGFGLIGILSILTRNA